MSRVASLRRSLGKGEGPVGTAEGSRGLDVPALHYRRFARMAVNREDCTELATYIDCDACAVAFECERMWV